MDGYDSFYLMERTDVIVLVVMTTMMLDPAETNYTVKILVNDRIEMMSQVVKEDLILILQSPS
ncbi:hypothetical protein C5167_038935 [Papaver somniferum]|uniref:Uncharacterized protein n=1 Tax=Papaver somniferum TaxID=3469 RepID=A0A4Y7IAP1_PAPSO|nr:hypothetical protein C5167_038935 [Papaver somniferum]